jgi:uncharacterized membrane protein YeaQ/YmgE (transglycosylase-associated protein family)
VGSLVVGQVYDSLGWTISIAVMVVALIGAIVLARPLRTLDS